MRLRDIGGIMMATKTTVKTVKKQETTAKTKATPVKAEPAKVTPAKATPVKENVVEAAPVKVSTTQKKPSAKKAVAKKEIKVKTVVEYFGRQVEEKDVIASVKKAWTKSGKKIGDIKTIELYIKPEEETVYYVVNETETGSVAF